MASHVFLGMLEVLALVSCLWGLKATVANHTTKLDLFYNSLWFIFGSIANILGIISAYYAETQANSEDFVTKVLLHRHYVMSWITVVIGYPMLVASFYMKYYAAPWANLITLAALIPFGIWFTYPNRLIAISTQVTIGTLIPVHAWIAHSTGNWPALYGTAAMAVNLISLSTPIRYEYWGLCPREFFITTVGVSSIFFAQALDTMTRDPNCLCYKAR